jgi:hypothetical protein
MERRLLGVIILAAALAFLAGSLMTFALMQWTWRISSHANLKVLGIGVYKDSGLTIPVTQIDWGILEPGDSKNITVYIKNESNVPITLTMWTEDWNPLNAAYYIRLSWNYDGTEMPVDGFIQATFTLNVDSAVTGISSFSFTIVIVGSG